MMSAVLLLFDIDGTLLTGAARAHAEAMLDAIGEVYGLTDVTALGVQPAGRTDPEIARLILLQHDIGGDRIDRGMSDLMHATVEQFALRCPPSLADCVIPGMADLLRSLAARPEIELSLVTGNLESVARLKLARAGIGELFARDQGGFGSDSEDRTDLPAIARRRAGLDGAGPYPRERTVVIGDTPRDIACARADGVRCLAVTTGSYGAEELGDADGVATSTDALSELIDAELARTGA
jgi:phosphoglycolate phosphatase-like HAD superfamily hydrolase